MAWTEMAAGCSCPARDRPPLLSWQYSPVRLRIRTIVRRIREINVLGLQPCSSWDSAISEVLAVRHGVFPGVLGAILAFPGRSIADSVMQCGDGSIPGDYIDSGSGRIWCAQDGIWNAIPMLFAFFHPLSPWIPIVLGVAAVAFGGTLTGHSASITGWVSGGRIISATYHPAVPGSASLVLRLLGALLVVGGFVVLAIGLIFTLTG